MGMFFTASMQPDEEPLAGNSQAVLRTADRRTTLSNGHTTVHTAEHLLSALYAAGIYHARIELTASEIPILDGSALALVGSHSPSWRPIALAPS